MMNYIKKFRYQFFLLFTCLLLALGCILLKTRLKHGTSAEYDTSASESLAFESPTLEVIAGSDNNYIKWVDFGVSYEALCKAYDLDVSTYDSDVHLNWIELLAYVGAKCGGNFDKSSLSLLDKLACELSAGETTIAELTENMNYYDYYYEAYEAVLGGMVGEYEIEQENDSGKKVWKKVYGLKAFSPIAKGFPYNDYDDFGSSRSYGYKRQHLGHDMMGQIGTPICLKNYI